MIRFVVKAAKFSKRISVCLTIILQNNQFTIIIIAQLINMGHTYDHVTIVY